MSPRQALNAINERTHISAGTAFTILTILVGGGLGYTKLREEIVENRERTMANMKQMEKLSDSISDLSRNLSEMKGRGK